MKKLLFAGLLPAIIIFLAYEVLTYIDNNFRPGRMWETPAVKPHEEEMPVMEGGVMPFAGGEAAFRAARTEDLKAPFPEGDTSRIAAGEALYFTYCAPCHGKYLDGNGTVGQSFHPLPGDLRGAKVQSMSEGLIFKEISYGIPNGRQPPLATTIDVLDRWRIIAYVKSLGPRK